MRIELLDLRKYGHFEGQCLDFASFAGKLIIIVGPNESGKTTTLNAVRHWLYGFPAHMGGECHRHGNEVLIGGRLAFDKNILECLRTRKKKTPLVAFDGKTALKTDALQACLGDITEERFVNLFGLSHARLREGGKEIAGGEGHLGQALFAAASGLTGLRRLRNRIVERRDALYRPRAQQPGLNVAKKEYEEAKDRLKHGLVSAPEVENWTKQANDAKLEVLNWNKQRDEAQVEYRELQRITSARPLLDRRLQLSKQLEQMRDIPYLRADFEADWKPLPGQLAGQRELVRSHSFEIARLEGVLANMPTADIVLLQAEAIEKLHAACEQRTKASSAKIAAEQLVRDTGGEAKQALREIGLDPLDFERHIDTLRVDPPVARGLRKLASDFTGIEQEVRTTRAAREDIEEEISNAAKNLSELSSTTSRESLDLLVARLDQGDPFAALECLDAEIVNSEKGLNALQKRLAIRADWETAADWPIPTAETIRGFDARLTKEETDRREFDRELRAARDAQRKAEAALASTEADGVVPLPTDWAAAKAHRDATWATIQGVWLAGRPADEPDDHLAARFGDEINEADELADRLRRDAERVSRKGQAKVDCEDALKAISDRYADLQRTAARTDEANSQWQELWGPFGLTPETPKAMLEWRLSWESLVKAAGDHRSLLTRRESASRRRDEFLTDARAELGDEVAPANVVALVRRRHKEANQLQGQRDQAEKNLTTLRDSLPKKRKLEDDATQKRRIWDEQWQQTVKRMPEAVRSNLEPASASDVIEAIEKFRGRIDFRKGRQGDVDKAKKELETWDSLFNEVASQLGESPAGDNPTARVPTWKTRLDAARKVERERESLTTQLDEQRQKLDRTKTNMATLEERLRNLQNEIGADTFDDIPDILRQSDEKKTLADRLERECESSLRELAAGQPMDEFEARVLAYAGQDLAGQTEAAQEKIRSCEANRDAAVQSAAEADAQLAQLYQKQGGFKARAEMEAALARMRHLLPDYVVAVLAEKVLDRAVERYRERNQGELFASASAYFRCLTCGSFHDLIPDENDRGEPILVGLRATGRVTVDGMSDGTCDQLYLALRLAHLAKHMHDHGPFPVIFDDILMAFDNPRASAALDCLVKLAAQTQVFLFTHHDHVRELAIHSQDREQIGVIDMASLSETPSPL